MAKGVYKLSLTDCVNFYVYLVAESAEAAAKQYRSSRIDYQCDEEEPHTEGPDVDEFTVWEDEFAEEYVAYCMEQDAKGELCAPFFAWQKEIRVSDDE
jgi:hypothetical protein